MSIGKVELLSLVGGPARLREIIERFYERLFSDLLVGFFFEASDQEKLVESQVDYLLTHLGDHRGRYQGPSIRHAHAGLPITSGHFDRRHQILREVLLEYEVEDSLREAWLSFDLALRPLVVTEGEKNRSAVVRPK